MTKRIAIVGGGISGLTAAWQVAQLARNGADVEATLFESSPRFGGIVETVHQDEFLIECGPDGWVSEKPWARDLAVELGLGDQLLPSNDATRKTHILMDGRLQTMPDGMRMMVPTDLEAVDRSHLFSPAAKRAFHQELQCAEELRAAAPAGDESIASFTRRHFGEEVLTRIAAPLLSGVLGGDVESLSARAVMPQFVAMERTHGSLIAGLRERYTRDASPIFTTLLSGLGTLVDRLVREIPPRWLHRETQVQSLARSREAWRLDLGNTRPAVDFDQLFLALPPRHTRRLLGPLDRQAASLLDLAASSAIIVAFGYRNAPSLSLPEGFGFLVPPDSPNELLACTFADQKFVRRVPPRGHLLRAFFGGSSADALLGLPNAELASRAKRALTAILGTLPEPEVTVIRRWPQSLPQYAVGHGERMAVLLDRLRNLPGLTLLGNGYRGVGLPDLIRDARDAARRIVT